MWLQRGRVALVWSAVVCLLSLAFLGLCASFTSLQIRETAATTSRAVDHISEQSDLVVSRLNTTADGIDTTVKTVNRTVGTANSVLALSKGSLSRFNTSLDRLTALCPLPTDVDAAIHPCGTFADINRTLATFRGTAGEIEKAAIHENKNLSTLDTQEAQLYGDIHTTFVNTNKLLTSDDVTGTLHNLNTTSKTVSNTATHVDATAADVHTIADKYAHPSKKKVTFRTATEAAGDFIRHFLPPIL